MNAGSNWSSRRLLNSANNHLPSLEQQDLKNIISQRSINTLPLQSTTSKLAAENIHDILHNLYSSQVNLHSYSSVSSHRREVLSSSGDETLIKSEARFTFIFLRYGQAADIRITEISQQQFASSVAILLEDKTRLLEQKSPSDSDLPTKTKNIGYGLQFQT